MYVCVIDISRPFPHRVIRFSRKLVCLSSYLFILHVMYLFPYSTSERLLRLHTANVNGFLVDAFIFLLFFFFFIFYFNFFSIAVVCCMWYVVFCMWALLVCWFVCLFVSFEID